MKTRRIYSVVVTARPPAVLTEFSHSFRTLPETSLVGKQRGVPLSVPGTYVGSVRGWGGVVSFTGGTRSSSRPGRVRYSKLPRPRLRAAPLRRGVAGSEDVGRGETGVEWRHFVYELRNLNNRKSGTRTLSLPRSVLLSGPTRTDPKQVSESTPGRYVTTEAIRVGRVCHFSHRVKVGRVFRRREETVGVVNPGLRRPRTSCLKIETRVDRRNISVVGKRTDRYMSRVENPSLVQKKRSVTRHRPSIVVELFTK